MKKQHLWWLAAVAGLGLAAMPARADGEAGRMWEQDRGLRLGIYLNSAGMEVEDEPDAGPGDQLYLEEEGEGMLFSVGYAFSPLFALCATLGGTSHETTIDDLDAHYATFFIEGHFRFMPESRVRPYLVAGLGSAALAIDEQGYDSETVGGGMTLGVGMLFNLTNHLLLDAALRVDAVTWDDIEVTRKENGQKVRLDDPIDEKGGAGRFQLGLTYAF